MKKMKKLFAVLLALAMVLGMSVTAFATEGEAPTKKMPTAADTKLATVTNIEEAGVTVTAYKVVKANYDQARGFTGYAWVDGTGYNAEDSIRALFVDVNGEKTLNIDEAAITELAEKAKNGNLGAGIEMTKQGDSTTYGAELEAGSYVVLVTGSNETIYNPMLVGVYYTVEGSGDNNTLVTEALDATSNWNLLTQNGYAKSSSVPFEKEIVDSGSGNNHGDDVAIGDTVSFKITTKLPSYSDEYENPIFKVSDTISDGLTYENGTLKVQTKDEEGNLVDIATSNYDDPGFSASVRTFTVNFKSDFIKNNQNADIIITYDAVLNEDAGINYDPNTNTATLEYSNSPDEDEDLVKKEDKTYHYTFGIDASLKGKGSEQTKEVYKLDENGTATVEGEIVTVESPLNGAKFELRKKNADGTYTKVAETKSGDGGVDGDLSFTGLDAGEYILVETEAPSGYSLDPTEHTVLIEAEYYDKGEEGGEYGQLKSYSITIDGEATSTYEATYSEDNGTVVTTIDKTDISVTGIKNTKLTSLPSTGGIGTTIFTIGGCLIMIIAAGLFFASRRKSAK